VSPHTGCPHLLALPREVAFEAVERGRGGSSSFEIAAQVNTLTAMRATRLGEYCESSSDWGKRLKERPLERRRKDGIADYFFFLLLLADFFDFFFHSNTSSQDFMCLGPYPRLGILWHLLAFVVWPA
jgi:hypothetical protein